MQHAGLIVGSFLEAEEAQKEKETTLKKQVSCFVTKQAEEVPGYRETEAAEK